MDRYLLPMGAAIWSVPTEQMMAFPARRLIEFFANHGLLDLSDRPQWYVVPDGSDRYVQMIAAELGPSLRLSSPVTRVRRFHGGVEISVSGLKDPRAAAVPKEADDGTSSAGESLVFDAVVFACHSDDALALLSDPTPAEKEILGAVRFQQNEVVLHTDTSLMPRARAAWAAWNYRLPAERGVLGTTVTYWMNRLQHIDIPTQLLVTLNQTSMIDPSKVLARVDYSHPVLDAAAVAAQGRRREISGQHRTWYCGAWWRYGFHEDGCLSAEEVVRDIAAGSL
jgi:predicted NAD/FAD-binding protein